VGSFEMSWSESDQVKSNQFGSDRVELEHILNNL